MNDLNSVLFPRLCFGCNVRLYRGEQFLCTFCRNQLPLTEYSFNEENAVDRIFYGRTDVKKAGAFLFFSEKGIVQNLIHKLKYEKQEEIGRFLGDWYGREIAETGGLQHVDYVIPVPLHRKKLKKRGYNQVDLFASTLAEHLQASYLPGFLIKNIHTRTQTTKQRIYRSQPGEDLFSLSDTETLRRKHVLLVDDVITTGATIEACARAIHKSPGVQVSVASMAVVP